MNLNSLFVNSLKTSSQLINYQIIRKRAPKKPFWLGIAKSKRFIVPEPRVIRTPEEKKEYTLLVDQYEIEMKSLLHFITETDPKLEEYSEINEDGKRKHNDALEAEILKSYENNAVWNAESARRREERMKIEHEKYVEEALQLMEIKEQKEKVQMERIEEVVKKEKILSESYITPENLDKAIEDCLNKIEEYDFAIDLDGNRYPGRVSLTHQQPEKQISESPRV